MEDHLHQRHDRDADFLEVVHIVAPRGIAQQFLVRLGIVCIDRTRLGIQRHHLVLHLKGCPRCLARVHRRHVEKRPISILHTMHYEGAWGVLATALAVALAAYVFCRAKRLPAKEIERVYPEAAQPGWKGTLRADPAPPPVAHGQVFCYDPATGYVLDQFPSDTPETIYAKVTQAAAAQRTWRASSWEERRQLLRTIHAWVLRDMEMIARIACRDTGKTAIDAAFGELLTTCAKLQWTIANGERVLRPEQRSGNLLLAHKRCTVVHEPLGVVAACVSWNYPVHNMLGPVISALFAGNAIVIKCSEHVAWTSRHILAAVRRCLAACGFPEDLVQVVVCAPEHAESLTRDARLAHITFIGSDLVGRKVALAAAPQLTATTLELGGKDPAVILPGTNLAFFASMFLRACFQAMGQNCIGIERFIVPRSMADELVGVVSDRIAALRCGSTLDETRFGLASEREDAVDCGAMISDARFGQLEALIQDAVAHGATLVHGGRRLAHPRWPLGHYFAPTLLTNVTPDMKIANEELFAPVFLIMVYDTVDEAVRIANGTPFGLGSSVFGPERGLCLDVASQLECGMVNINDFGISYLNQGLPFGGCKDSGYGRFAGPEGLLGLTRPKARTEDVAFGLVQTSIPPVVDYPIRNTAKSWQCTSHCSPSLARPRAPGVWLAHGARPGPRRSSRCQSIVYAGSGKGSFPFHCTSSTACDLILSSDQRPPGPPLAYLRQRTSPISSQACRTSSMSSLVCAELTQKRTRDEMSGVAG